MRKNAHRVPSGPPRTFEHRATGATIASWRGEVVLTSKRPRNFPGFDEACAVDLATILSPYEMASGTQSQMMAITSFLSTVQPIHCAEHGCFSANGPLVLMCGFMIDQLTPGA